MRSAAHARRWGRHSRRCFGCLRRHLRADGCRLRHARLDRRSGRRVLGRLRCRHGLGAGGGRRLARRRRSRGRHCRRRRLLDRGPCIRRSCGGRPRRQERQRVDVALVVRGHTHTEVDERLGQVDDAARPHRSDDSTFAHGRAALDADRAEVDERRGVPGRRLNGDGLAARRHGPREGDHARRRREDFGPARRADVDAAMLAGRIRMGVIERERMQDGSIDRPGPGLRRRNGQYECAQQHDSESREHDASLLPDLRTE